MTNAVVCRVNGRRLIFGLALLAGCTASYQPGSFTDYGRVDEPRARALDCLDVRLQPRGEGAVGRRWVAIDYEIGNRCSTPVDVDFRNIAVFGEVGQAIMPMSLYDPRDEVVLATLDGRGYAAEALAYEPRGIEGANVERVCVDVSGMAEGERVPPVCFRRDGETMRVEAVQ